MSRSSATNRPLKPPKPLPKVATSLRPGSPQNAPALVSIGDSAGIGAIPINKYKSKEEERAAVAAPEVAIDPVPIRALPKPALGNESMPALESVSPSKKSRFLSPEHWQENSKSGGAGKFKYQLSATADGLGDCNDMTTSDNFPEVMDASVDRANIYCKTHYSDEWMYITILTHVVQFSLLLSYGGDTLSGLNLTLMIVIVVSVALLLLTSRYFTVKLPKSIDWSYSNIRSPDQETDIVSNTVIFTLALAAIIEGLAYAIYPTLSASYDPHRRSSGMRSYSTLSHILSFGSIVLFGFHKILRPSNRLDPIRTVFELEIVSICWDALDGSSLYELLVDTPLSNSMGIMARLLMCIWYLSIGLRLAMMYCAHLHPDTLLYKLVLSPALSWSPEPTVDRTLSSIYFRTFITLMMCLPQFLAAALRIALWSKGELSPLQQEMMAKNVLFLIPTGTSILNRMRIKGRYWNTRKLLIEVLRYTFVVTYLATGTLFSSILVSVSPESNLWINNIGTDFVLCVLFLVICRAVHKPTVWILFPQKVALVLGILLTLNLYVARIPAIYRSADLMASDSKWSYNNFLLIVLVSIIPISAYALFWAVCNMVFHREFTACPENYNAVHDPATTLVSTASMLDGALDIISCASMLSLATNEHLPGSVDGAIIFFAFLEIVNACQSFMLQVLLSAGHDDTPADLVRWRAKLRLGRGLIDLGTFALRVALWVRFGAVASVFLVKNLYNIFHTVSLVERSRGVKQYRKDTLFMQYVRPKDWYGLTQEEWREATRESLPEQARSGRVV